MTGILKVIIEGGKAAGKKLIGPSRKSGNIKDKDGNIIGSRIYKEGSKKAMGIPQRKTKSDYFFTKQSKKSSKKS